MKDRKDIKFSVTKKEKSFSVLKFVVPLCIIIIIIILLVIFGPKILENIQSSGDYTFSKIEGSNILDMQEYKKNVVLLTQTKTVYIEKNGNTHTGSVFTYSNPVMKVNNGNVLVYDRGGTGYRVEHYRNTLYHEDAPGIIVTAQISKKNTVAFSVDSESDSFAQTCVYIRKSTDSDIKNIYKSSTGYCIAIAISDDDKYVAMAMLDGKNAENVITPVIYSTENDEIVSLEPLSGIVLTGIDFMSDNTLSLYSDTCIYHFDKKSFAKSIADSFNATDFISTTVNPCGLTAILLANNGNKLTPIIKIFESNGYLKYTVSFEGSVDKICCSENYFAVLSDNDIYVYSHSGSLIGKFKTEDKNKNICLTDKNLYILQSSGVYITDLSTGENGLFISGENSLNESITVSLASNTESVNITEETASVK